MNLTFAAQLNKMITAGMGGAVEAPETGVAVGRRVEYTSIGPAPILTFEANSELPLKALSVNMEPIQEGTGDPSPENVRPISGRQSVKVTRAGVNVWDEEWENGIYSSSGKTGGDAYIRCKNLISVVPGQSYRFVAPAITIYAWGYSDLEYSNALSITIFTPFTVPDGVRYIGFAISKSQYGSDTYRNDISLNYPATDTEYHPGTVASVEIPLGQTVYGGTVDVTTGEMVVDRATVDMGTLEWQEYSGNSPRFVTYLQDAKPGVIGSVSSAFCSMFKTVATGYDSGTYDDYSFYISASKYLHVRDTQYTDKVSFKTAMSGVQLCYELAQPITITLTPEQLTTVLGTNNVWSDADEVSLTYGNIYYTEGY